MSTGASAGAGSAADEADAKRRRLSRIRRVVERERAVSVLAGTVDRLLACTRVPQVLQELCAALDRLTSAETTVAAREASLLDAETVRVWCLLSTVPLMEVDVGATQVEVLDLAWMAVAACRPWREWYVAPRNAFSLADFELLARPASLTGLLGLSDEEKAAWMARERDRLRDAVAGYSTTQVISALENLTWRMTDEFPKPAWELDTAFFEQAVTFFRLVEARAMVLATLCVSRDAVTPEYALRSDAETDATAGTIVTIPNFYERERAPEPSRGPPPPRDANARALAWVDAQMETENAATVLAETNVEFARECRVYCDWLEKEFVSSAPLVVAETPEWTDLDELSHERLRNAAFGMVGRLDKYGLKREWMVFTSARRLLPCDLDMWRVRYSSHEPPPAQDILARKNEGEFLPPKEILLPVVAQETPMLYCDFSLDFYSRNTCGSSVGIVAALQAAPQAAAPRVVRSYAFRRFVATCGPRKFVFPSVSHAFVWMRRRGFVPDRVRDCAVAPLDALITR